MRASDVPDAMDGAMSWAPGASFEILPCRHGLIYEFTGSG